MTYQHVEKLMNVPKFIQTEMKIVHRDVRPSNFFHMGTDGKVLLNDWADSVSSEAQQSTYASVPDEYKAPELKSIVGPYMPKPEHDPYSLVMSCSEILGITDTSPPVWQKALSAALSPSNHVVVLKLRQEILPIQS